MRCALLGDDPVAKSANSLDCDLDDVAWLEPHWRLTGGADPAAQHREHPVIVGGGVTRSACRHARSTTSPLDAVEDDARAATACGESCERITPGATRSILPGRMALKWWPAALEQNPDC